MLPDTPNRWEIDSLSLAEEGTVLAYGITGLDQRLFLIEAGPRFGARYSAAATTNVASAPAKTPSGIA
jgi:hypothetical protein